ncbi:MAG: sortase [Clostridiales bacterium]|jgi:sortase A|nr:sortase [Clostridiales bacterium]
MRKTITMLLPLLILATAAAPALAADYSFSSGGESLGCFGAATSAEAPAGPDPALSNARRNKDAALLPPPYGAFSGDIPTDPSSPYHSNLPESGFAPAGQALPPIGNEGHAPGGAQLEIAQAAAPAAAQAAAPVTEPLYYGDGSIGTLRVEKTGRTVRVYEGVGLANLKIGAGHFPATSAWDGNVALAGHNRGGSAYFSFVKDLQSGDRLTYTTKYGSRAYVVYSKTQIDEYDNLPLSWSGENTLSLITCVANVPANRYYVAAAEAPQPGQA